MKAELIRRRRRRGGGTGAGLQAPTITWDNDIGDVLPDFSITYDARVNDIIVIRRSAASDFASYEEASDAVESLSPPTTLEFDFGGDWATGIWFVKCYYIRGGRVSDISSTVSIIIEANGLYVDFTADDMSIIDVATPANDYNGSPDGKLTKTISANGTYTNSAGVLTQKTANTIHVDYDPATLLPQGLMAWEARTNLLLNSTINGANLATQSVSVTAVAHTLSFYGTGTITLSGASTAGPLVGSAAYPTRSTLTFTPSAASLTLTVTGTVQFAQLEVGAFASPYIPTAGSSVTRAIDTVSLLLSAIPHSATEWTTILHATPRVSNQTGDGTARFPYILSDNTFNESNYVNRPANSNSLTPQLVDGGAAQATLTSANITFNTPFKAAFAVKANDVAYCRDGGTVSTDSSATLPTVDRIIFGASWAGNANAWCGHIHKLIYVPRRMTNAELQAATT